jgi:hypothetical protein
MLGQLYLVGDGAARDPVQAAQWFRKSAEQGIAPAQLNLGMMLLAGQGVAVNEQEGASWVRRAAEQGLEGAQYSLGGLYKDGRGVAKDAVEAYAWYDTSGANGYKEAYKERDALATSMDAAAVEKARKLAAEYLGKYRLPVR